jgi:hypothetical protein
VAEDKKRRLNADVFNEGTVAMPFIKMEGAVLQTLEGNGQSTRQTCRIDRKTFLPEKANPLLKSDASQQTRPDRSQQSFPPTHAQ